MASEMRLVSAERNGVLNLAGALDEATATRLDKWTSSHRLPDPLAFEERGDFTLDLGELTSMDTMDLFQAGRGPEIPDRLRRGAPGRSHRDVGRSDRRQVTDDARRASR